MEAIVIIGLPGSGKTTYALTLGGLLVDDASVHYQELTKALDGDEPLIVITDPNACFTSRKNIADTVGRRKLKIVCFENDPITCWENMVRRGDNRVSFSWLCRFARDYDVERLDPDIVIPVYNNPNMCSEAAQNQDYINQ